MSALPPFHQFHHGRTRPGHRAERSQAFEATPLPDSEIPQEAVQAAWSYVRPAPHDMEAAETDVYPRSVRLLLIAVLALVSWVLVWGLARLVAHLLP